MNSRRRFLAGTAAAGAALTLGWMGGRRDLDEAVRDSRFHPDGILGQGESARLWYRYSFIGQPVMDTQLMFVLGLASAGLTDVGEVLDTATRISVADERSWFDAWYATAERVAAYGEDALSRGHKTSAASHFLRAGAYYRAGLIRYADRTDPRLVEATRRRPSGCTTARWRCEATTAASSRSRTPAARWWAVCTTRPAWTARPR
jgi:hypothetical protein